MSTADRADDAPCRCTSWQSVADTNGECIRCDDAGHLHQDPATEFLTAYGETPALDVCQSKWATAELLAEDAILLTEIVDQIVLVPVQPASDRKDEEVQRRGHPGRLPGLGRNLLSPLGLSSAHFSAPYGIVKLTKTRLTAHQDDGLEQVVNRAYWGTINPILLNLTIPFVLTRVLGGVLFGVTPTAPSPFALINLTVPARRFDRW